VNAVLVGAGIVLALAAILATGVVVTALAAVAVSAATAGFSRLSGRLIGGHTGDTIGATEQIARSVMLVGLAMAA
jgi:adenosylcobinamide-GDP ribazoletransferase